MRGHVVVCGPVSWNSIVVLDHLPDPTPHMQFALEHFETIGGTSAGKALHLAGLGRSVVCRTVVGDDERSEGIVRALEAAGVRMEATPTTGPPERHLNLMTPAGERVSIYLSSPTAPGPEATAFAALIEDADAVVMDLSEASRALLPTAVASGRPVWTDIHDYDGRNPFHTPFIESASYVFMNADGMPEPEEFMRARVAAGARAVVCTLGARGAIAADRHGMHRVDAVPTTVRDANGAGDAFLSGYLDATLTGSRTPEALAAASRQAVVALRSRHLHPVLEQTLGG